ncbi:hypothetical protein BKA81DRAFT_370409 [Phyllosticta paracitricarpa]
MYMQLVPLWLTNGELSTSTLNFSKPLSSFVHTLRSAYHDPTSERESGVVSLHSDYPVEGSPLYLGLQEPDHYNSTNHQNTPDLC